MYGQIGRVQFRMLCIWLTCTLPGISQAAFEGQMNTAWNQSSGGITALSAVPSASLRNPAELQTVTSYHVELSHSRLFKGLGISSNSFSAIAHLQEIPMQFSVSTLGDKHYSETILSVAGVMVLDPRFCTGLRLNIMGVSLQGYGSASCRSLSWGSAFQISESLRWGLLLENVFHWNTGVLSPLPERYETALGWSSGIQAMTFAWSKEGRMPASMHSAYSLDLGGRVRISTGYQTRPARIGLGIGLRFGTAEVTLSTQDHPVLTPSHAFILKWIF